MDTKPAIRAVADFAVLSSVMVARHPILRRLGEVGREAALHPEAGRAGLTAREMVTHVLQGAEARVITTAMRTLRDHPKPTLALPMHDGLIVPVSTVSATVAALGAAWREITRTVPLVLTVARAGHEKEVITLPTA